MKVVTEEVKAAPRTSHSLISPTLKGGEFTEHHLKTSHLVQTLTFQMRKPRHRIEVLCTFGFLNRKEGGGLNEKIIKNTKKEVSYFNSLQVAPLQKGALQLILFKAASQPEAEMNNY